jgi:hypothetical protein
MFCFVYYEYFFLLYKRFSNKKKDCFYYIVIELLKKKRTNQLRLIKGIEIRETFLDKIILKEKNHFDVMNNILLMQNMYAVKTCLAIFQIYLYGIHFSISLFFKINFFFIFKKRYFRIAIISIVNDHIQGRRLLIKKRLFILDNIFTRN